MTNRQCGKLNLGGYEFQVKDCDSTKLVINEIPTGKADIRDTISMEFEVPLLISMFNCARVMTIW